MTKLLAASRVRGLAIVGTKRTHAEWTTANPVLKSGDIAVSSDLRQFKIGDGTTTWAKLDYFSGEPVINESVADQVLNAADTYVTGSALAAPPTRLAARASMRWRLWATKTAAGIATPIFNIRVGAAGAIGDAAKLVITLPAQTGAADSAFIDVLTILRNIGASAVLSGAVRMNHELENTGFSVIPAPAKTGISASFSTALDDLIVGLSVHPGAAGVWTVQGCLAELMDT